MRRIAILNQKGGVGKTTTAANLGAALARLGRRVVVIDMDPQANLTLHLGLEPSNHDPSTYSVLMGQSSFADALRATATAGLSVCPSHIDLSGAELELAGAIGRERVLSEAIATWEEASEGSPCDYLLFDCAPSLGLLTINALTAAREVLITLQTEFFALQGMSKLIEVVDLLQRRLNPDLKVTGILPCLYDSRLRLAREVLAEIRNYFPDQVFKKPIRTNVKLAEAPSYGQHIFDYAPESKGALDHHNLGLAMLAQEAALDPELAQLERPEEETQTSPVAPLKVAKKPVERKKKPIPAAKAAPPEEPVREASTPARSPRPPRAWDSPEVGDVVLEPKPRRLARPEAPAPSAEDLPALPDDAQSLQTPRTRGLRAHE